MPDMGVSASAPRGDPRVGVRSPSWGSQRARVPPPPAAAWWCFLPHLMSGTRSPTFWCFSEGAAAHAAVDLGCLWEELSSGSFCVTMFKQPSQFIVIHLFIHVTSQCGGNVFLTTRGGPTVSGYSQVPAVCFLRGLMFEIVHN